MRVPGNYKLRVNSLNEAVGIKNYLDILGIGTELLGEAIQAYHNTDLDFCGIFLVYGKAYPIVDADNFNKSKLTEKYFELKMQD